MFWHKKPAANLCVSGKVKVTFFKKFENEMVLT